ncbi:MAG: glycosyl hydrolase [Candidatus Eremiobacteraeota bacterium]|nr:glycosyl hydrolase [Candidatus Eremiobacteraeota bacterium]
MKRALTLAAIAMLTMGPLATAAATQTPTQKLMSKLEWRNIGPFIGGRVVAVTGVPSNPNLFYFGGVQGGIWRSTDYGQEWTNLSDGKIPGNADSIGAIAVAQSNPRVLYAGTGESDIRSDFDTGVGIYKTTDAGKTWQYAGLRDTHTTSALAIHPADPNIVYASSMGHVFKPDSNRGVFKTTDGGKTWKKILFVNDKTGAIDVVMNPRNARVLYASMWQAQRVPWKLTSGGPGSGLYKTVDGGAHWTNISKHPGFARDLLGRMGVAVSATNPNVVYAVVQSHDGGVFRSNDAGATWKRVNAEMKLRQRAFYYMSIYADPTNSKVAYIPEVDGVFKTTDAGRTWRTISPPGDHHIIWINPHDPKILLGGDDGGATVSTDGGKTWSSENNQPTGQYYHIAIDKQFPFHIYGAAQDEGAFEGPSATATGSIGLGDWHAVAAGESTFVAPQPGDPNVTYGSGYYSAMLRQDNSVGQVHNVSPWPAYFSGAPSSELRYRFGWTHPIFFSPANPQELLVAAQNVFSSLDEGKTWKILSPDLTRNDKSTEGNSGGPIDFDQTSAETFPDIASLAVSPLDGDVMWAGSADGLVHVTKNHGAKWALVTPPALPQWAQISSIEPSHISAGTAYLTASRYMWDDFHPYVYKTTDYGAHWAPMSNGLPDDQYVFVVRQDPREPRLLFAGTRSTAYVSFDGGSRWQSLALNLPGVQVRDMAIDSRQGELAIATHGRAVWILDNLALLEQLARTPQPSVAAAQLFAPETAWLSHSYGGNARGDVGPNPAYGATVFFNLPGSYDGKTPLTLSFQDARGATIRSFALHAKDKHAKKIAPEVRERMDAIHKRALDLEELTAVEPGMNRFQWDMRYAPAAEVPGFREPTTDDFLDNVDGPTIVPGAYTVVLQYGAKRLTQPMQLQLDPRLHPTTADLDARLALEMRVHATLESLNRTIAQAMTTRNRLPAAKRTQLDRAIADDVQLNIHSTEGDVLYETKLRDHIAFFANELELAYEKPTAAEYATYADLQSKATAAESRLKTLVR